MLQLQEPNKKEWIRPSELVKLYGCTRQAVYLAIKLGKLEAGKVGNSIFIRRASIPEPNENCFFPRKKRKINE